MACSTTNAKGLMKAAIRDNNPVLFFEHVLLYNLSEELPEVSTPSPSTKPRWCVRARMSPC